MADPNVPAPASTGQPFIGPTQAKRARALCIVLVDGVNVTAQLKPHLINVHVIDGPPNAGVAIELDDRDSKMIIPPIGADLEILLGWKYESMVAVFTGQVTDVESGFSRTQGGRRLWVHGTAVSMSGEIKTPRMETEGAGAEPGQTEGKKVPFQQMFSKVFGAVGMQAKVHDALNAQRDHWMQNNESAMQWGQRMADELGGIFNLSKKDGATITQVGENANGSRTGVIIAKWGDNLIGWRVHIKVTRSTFSTGAQQSYNLIKGAWDKLTKAFNNPMGTGKEGGVVPTSPAANETQSDQQNQGSSNEADNAIANGRIVINGEPRAHSNQNVELVNARPGVDGFYYSPSCEHIYSREGYITWMNVVSTTHVGESGVQVGAGLQYKIDTPEGAAYKQYKDRRKEIEEATKETEAAKAARAAAVAAEVAAEEAGTP